MNTQIKTISGTATGSFYGTSSNIKEVEKLSQSELEESYEDRYSCGNLTEDEIGAA